jgi:hypothetical protein
MRIASLFEVTNTGRGIKMDAPRSEEEAMAAMSYYRVASLYQVTNTGRPMKALAAMQGQGQQRQAVRGGAAGGNVVDAFHRRDCQIPFNINGMKVDTGDPATTMRAFQQGLHIGMGNRPTIGGGQGGMGQQRARLAQAFAGRQQGGMGRMGGGQELAELRGTENTNCGDNLHRINVMVQNKQGQNQTIRGLIDSGAGVALMSTATARSLGFSNQDAIRMIQAQGEQAMAVVPLINIMATFPPNPMPLAMNAAVFDDGQGTVFTPFPTCDITMRCAIDIDNTGHTLTSLMGGETMRYDCEMGAGMGQGRGMNMRGGRMM